MARSYFKNYLQTPTPFSSNSKRSFEAVTTKIRSTKSLPTKDKLEAESSPNQESRTQEFFYTCNKGGWQKYSDLTGRYPIIYSLGNHYIVIYYYWDTNSIQYISNKTLNAAKIQDATISMLSILTTSGNQPNLHILDN